MLIQRAHPHCLLLLRLLIRHCTRRCNSRASTLPPLSSDPYATAALLQLHLRRLRHLNQCSRAFSVAFINNGPQRFASLAARVNSWTAARCVGHSFAASVTAATISPPASAQSAAHSLLCTHTHESILLTVTMQPRKKQRSAEKDEEEEQNEQQEVAREEKKNEETAHSSGSKTASAAAAAAAISDENDSDYSTKQTFEHRAQDWRRKVSSQTAANTVDPTRSLSLTLTRRVCLAILSVDVQEVNMITSVIVSAKRTGKEPTFQKLCDRKPKPVSWEEAEIDWLHSLFKAGCLDSLPTRTRRA